MASINLSQSIQEKQALARGRFFDRGFFINLTILIIIVGGYGGSIWYLGTLEKELLSLRDTLAQKTVGLKEEGISRSVNRAVDIRDRIDAITVSRPLNPDLLVLFSNLEKATLGTIQMTEYLRSDVDRTVEISGVTSSLRYLAQQMVAFKRLDGVESVHADEVSYNEETGKIEFTLLLMMSPVSTTDSGTTNIPPV